MFSLLAGLWDYFYRQREYNILILGVEMSGKTTFLERIKVLVQSHSHSSPIGSIPSHSLNTTGLSSSTNTNGIANYSHSYQSQSSNNSNNNNDNTINNNASHNTHAHHHYSATVGLNIAKITVNDTKLVLWDLGGQNNLRGIWEKYYADAHAVLFFVDSSDESRMDDAKMCLHRVVANKDLEGAPLLVAVNKQDKMVANEPDINDDNKVTTPRSARAVTKDCSLKERSTHRKIEEEETAAHSNDISQNSSSSSCNTFTGMIDNENESVGRRSENEPSSSESISVRKEVKIASTADILISFGLDEMAADKGLCSLRVQPTSAITGDGLYEGVRWLINAVSQSPRTDVLYRKEQMKKQKIIQYNKAPAMMFRRGGGSSIS